MSASRIGAHNTCRSTPAQIQSFDGC